ncbi:MAG: Gfo/Idh/MocA family oxidoreductase [Acidobacteria bacterium]|nr:Gfo/Idh/MocA family oxidoreductase [Acidobacteriota bacterium]MBI3279470.1 Gfo/Idh/MocA family oxidoreductase [Acidobacteriota bacterium]
MKERYRVLVAGMGKRGMHHAAAFQTNPRFELAGICDPDEARLEDASAKLGAAVKGKGVREVAGAVRPDVFCFCTPPHVRVDMVRAGVESGARLIAMEKPIALTSAEGFEIRDLLAASGVKAVVSHQHRYGEHYRKVKEVIASGALGRIHTVYGTATGWMMHMLSHLIDYMRWYNGEAEAEWVIAQAAGRGKLADLHPSPDYIAGFIHFRNGVHGAIECGAGAPDVPEVEYWWRKCRMGAQGTDGFAEVLTGGGWRAVTKEGACSGGGSMNYDLDMPPYIQEMADWLDDDSRIHSCHFGSAYQGFEIMMAFCRSAAQGGQVPLPLNRAADEIDLLRRSVPQAKVLLSIPASAKEYSA